MPCGLLYIAALLSHQAAPESHGCFVVEANPPAHSYDAVVCTGVDELGVVYATYELSHLLGVDPQAFWTEHPPLQQLSINITAPPPTPRPMQRRQARAGDAADATIPAAAAATVLTRVGGGQLSPTFQYRGFFVNDEDMLVSDDVITARPPPRTNPARATRMCSRRGSRVLVGRSTRQCPLETVRCTRGLVACFVLTCTLVLAPIVHVPTGWVCSRPARGRGVLGCHVGPRVRADLAVKGQCSHRRDGSIPGRAVDAARIPAGAVPCRASHYTSRNEFLSMVRARALALSRTRSPAPRGALFLPRACSSPVSLSLGVCTLYAVRTCTLRMTYAVCRCAGKSLHSLNCMCTKKSTNNTHTHTHTNNTQQTYTHTHTHTHTQTTHNRPAGVPYSFAKSRETLEYTWKAVAEMQAGKKMLWTVGYRGLNDYPFWNDDTSFKTDAARGALISEAMAAEAAAVRSATGEANPPMFTYLWSEMTPLYTGGQSDNSVTHTRTPFLPRESAPRGH